MMRLFGISLMLVLVLAGCQGAISEKPPVHLNQNMDFQEKFEAQEANTFFADGRAMRPPVPGTVARGFLKEDVAWWTGKNESGDHVDIPVELTMQVMERGQDRYNIYCSVCHGLAGDGQGIIMTGRYGYVPAPTFHSELLRAREDGYFFDVISHGVRSMPGYGQQVAVADRWAIVAYVRALQRSQYASPADVPENQR
jgi:mono/diheme cytochrome c family protein